MAELSYTRRHPEARRHRTEGQNCAKRDDAARRLWTKQRRIHPRRSTAAFRILAWLSGIPLRDAAVQDGMASLHRTRRPSKTRQGGNAKRDPTERDPTAHSATERHPLDLIPTGA